jgi:RNA polymerase sigma-70 factor, ECF subfamily
MTATDETALMLAAGRGDREAFGLLVERYHAAIVQFADRFLGPADRNAAEDLAQDVFLAAWQAAPTYRPRAKVLTWLMRMATNACLNYRRSRRLRMAVSLDAAVTAGSEADHPDARALADERAAVVREAVAGLPPNQRAAVLLRHFQGLSYREIADVLETSVSAVESLLFRAREALGVALSEQKPGAAPQVFPPAGVK